MSARNKARRRALDVLFEAEQRGEVVAEVLRQRVQRAETPLNPYVTTLVEGVQAHRERIDELIATYAIGWTLERMPAVDRNLLRIGVQELLWSADVPEGVAIAEAVSLARELSTEESPAFINGLLARIQELKPQLIAED